MNGRLKTVTTTHKTSATGTATAVSNSLRTYVYDTAGRVEKLLYGGAMSGTTPPATIHSGWQFTHDTAGRRDVVSSIATGTNKQVGWDYQYTGRGEVQQATRKDTASNAAFIDQWYIYAANGRRVAEASYKTGGGLFNSVLQSSSQSRLGDPTAVGTISRGKPAAWGIFNGTTFVPVPAVQAVEFSGHYTGTLRSGTAPVVTLENGTDITDPAEKTLGLPSSYRRLFQVDNPNATVGFFALTTVTTTDNSAGAGKTNVLKTWQYVPPKTETLAYDEDGNLRADARWKLTWDAENRLAVMEERAGIPYHPSTHAYPPPRQRIEFFYDSHHRRCAKKVFRLNPSTSEWDIWSSTLYFYDGWNLVAELDALNACTPLRTYAWGVDLSGSMSGAGGVGGLLMVKRHMRTYSSTSKATVDKSARYLVHSDANGNVKGFASIPMSGTIFATTFTGAWDYDAFGNRVSNTLPVAHELCRIGFSSKYEDPETGWLYYGFRFYDPVNGRWPNRDPIGEFGPDEDDEDFESDEIEVVPTANLYAFGPNDPINGFDSDGRIWGKLIREALKRLGPKILPKPRPPLPKPPAPKPPGPKPPGPKPKPKFGNCTAAEHAVLNAAVGAACKGPQFSCNKAKHPNLDCPEIQARIGRATACAAARAAINQKCYNGGDANHKAEQTNATTAAATCAARYAADCICGPPKPPGL